MPAAVEMAGIGLCGAADGGPAAGESDIIHQYGIGGSFSAFDQLGKSIQTGGVADLDCIRRDIGLYCRGICCRGGRSL